ncbi:MAG TPA: flippase activity-associated protein Agl23 [Ktedonobacteraceae bacterium]
MEDQRTFREKEYQASSSVNRQRKNGVVVRQKGSKGVTESPQAERVEAVSIQERKEVELDALSNITSGEDEAFSKVFQRTKFFPPSREWILTAVAFWGIILLGAVLRFWGLGDKPLHHDESLHAYFALRLMENLRNYQYNPLLHGPFQFHIIALVYKISQIVGAPDHGVNTTTVRIAAATLGTVIVGLPFFLRDYLGKLGAWFACFLLALSPSMVYFSRFAREDIYMACFTLLLVVAVGRYVRSRKGLWLVIAAGAFSLSYATKEATFLTIAVFGSFVGAVVMWELGLSWSIRSSVSNRAIARYLPKTAAPIALLLFFLILLPIAKAVLGWINTLSTAINEPRNANTANLLVQDLKDSTVALLPWLGMELALYIFSIIVREIIGMLPRPGKRGLAARVDARRQPLLDSLVSMPWTHWFGAIVCAISIFLLLFTVLFTNVKQGIGDGIWQGLYYWIQQQQQARGGQPWYYYLLLISLYEQIGVVFGLVGIVVCLYRPSRFRLFLVYWFVGNVFIYSWAGEKMPWLMIHMTMPLMLLAAIGLQVLVIRLLNLVVQWRLSRVKMIPTESQIGLSVASISKRPIAQGAMLLSVPVTLFLLVLTLQNMFQVTYVHPADGPHEMMIYVQTTTDVNTVMGKIDALDQKVDGGKHQLPIGVMTDAQWPFAWYLRDYTNVCFQFPTNCSDRNPAVIISAVSSLSTSQIEYATPTKNGKPPTYLFKRYHLRTWWDEGYKPPAAGGVGLFVWLSYGDNPPSSKAPFDLGRAMKNIWLWWWQRRPIGSTMGSTDMGLLIRKDLRMLP